MASPGRRSNATPFWSSQAVRLARALEWRRFPTQERFDSEGSRDLTDEDEETENESNVCADEEQCEGGSVSKKSSCRNVEPQSMVPLEDTITHLTKLMVLPSEGSTKSGRVCKEGVLSTLTMLSARQMNFSGLGRWSRAECCHVAARYLPVDGPKIVDRMSSRVYIGKFSSDGSLFVGGFQDRHIRVYNADENWTIRKDILARQLRWTVTDTALSNDQRFLIYASMSPIVHLVSIGPESGGVQSLANITDIHEGLDFSMEPSGDHSLGLYSIQFSQDGKEIVAGSNKKSIYVYDLEANKPVLRLHAHKDDVNAVTFADETCHLIYSGSDDHTCKVWDRRCLVSKSHPAGTLLGHLEGITFIDSRGDGRYFISNGKDQAIKLWDIRKMSSSTSLSKAKARKIPSWEWDYRWMDYPGSGKDVKHPLDQSVMTYKGHQVLRTLVRCYFSPVFTTGQKYIYTGSHDKCVYIYDLVSGKCVAKLGNFHRSTVRDCSWHPFHPVLVSSSWDGIIAEWEHLHGESVQGRGGFRPQFQHFYMDDAFESH